MMVTVKEGPAKYKLNGFVSWTTRNLTSRGEVYSANSEFVDPSVFTNFLYLLQTHRNCDQVSHVSCNSQGVMMLLKKFLILMTAVILTSGQSIDECLKQDSISCVQKTLYRTAKEFFAKDKLELVKGVNIVKSNVDTRSGKELAYDQEMEAASDIAERQNSLENFISDEAGQFLTGRSLRVHKKLLKLLQRV